MSDPNADLAGKAAAIEGQLLGDGQAADSSGQAGAADPSAPRVDFVVPPEAFVESLRRLVPRISDGFAPNWNISGDECESVAVTASPVASKWLNRLLDWIFPEGIAAWLKANPEEAKLVAVLTLIIVPRFGVPLHNPTSDTTGAATTDGKEEKPAG